MTFAAVTLLGMTLGQPLTPDFYPFPSRTIKIPIEYKKNRKDIRHVLLYVARNRENTWYQEGFVTPTLDKQDAFTYVAKDDGEYWFKMVLVDLKGNKDRTDLTQDQPDLKLLIDTVPPQVRFTVAKRNGKEVHVGWAVEDKFPNEAGTRLYFRETDNPSATWVPVKIPADSRTEVKIPCGTSDAVTVKVIAFDIAGNRAEGTQEFAAAESTSLSPPAGTVVPAPPSPPVGSGMGAIAPPPSADLVIPIGSGPIPPGPLPPVGPGPAPVGPVTPAVGPLVLPPVVPNPPVQQAQQYQPPVQQAQQYQQPQPQPPVTGGTGSNLPVDGYQPRPAPPVYTPPQPPVGGGGTAPLPTVDPRAQTASQSVANPAPTGGWAGAAPVAETVRAQIVSYTRFDLSFDLEQRGPSGISRVDLWVTRNEGKSWFKWSEHDGKGGSVRVILDVQSNTQLEGSYGFRLVPVSGAGLSDREPTAGDAPEMRVVLDLTAPQIELSLPAPDPKAPPPPDTLVIKWQATDRNFGDDPVTLEWGETSKGPWKSIVANEHDPVIQATAGNNPAVRRLPSAGQYAWRVPAGTPPRVYLKATARDAAGNVREVVTRDPQLVDVTKPRAKISGILPQPVTPQP